MAAVAFNKRTNLKAVKKPLSSSKSTIWRHSATKVSIGGEYHTRCRGFLRFRLLVRASVLNKKAKLRDCCGNEEEISSETRDLVGPDKAELRFDKKDDDLVQGSSVCDVQNARNGNNLRVSLLPHVEEVSQEPFIPLKEDEVAEVESAFTGINSMKVLVDICGETLQCLMPTRWLVDEVINLYLALLKERVTRDPKNYLKCHFFNTFFYTKLVSDSGYNYQAVRRWTRQRKLGYELIDCDIIFVPIHILDIHWTLAVINNKECKFQYLDSLNGSDRTILKTLAKYLVDEVKDKSGKQIDVSSWDFESVKDIPRQENLYDCGMFMLKYIDFYSRGLKQQFNQNDMPYFRLRTAKEILRLRAN